MLVMAFAAPVVVGIIEAEAALALRQIFVRRIDAGSGPRSWSVP